MNADLKKLMAEAPKRVVQIGTVVRIYLGEDAKGQVKKDIKRALARGQTVIEDGIATWVEDWPEMDTSKTGSDVYTWKDGNNVRVERLQFTKSKDGNVTRKSLGLAWRSASSVL